MTFVENENDNSKNVYNKLYNEHQKRVDKLKTKLPDSNDEIAECTFKPQINKVNTFKR